LFIFTDDHARHAIGAYGSKINQTPNLDRLANEGMLFRNCFCTNSICAPSRAVILTGKHSHLNGVIDNRATFDGSQQTFPKLLQRAGYETAMIGKWDLKSDPTGFSYWEVLPGQGRYYNPTFRTAEGVKKYTGYVTDITTDLTLDWLAHRRVPDKPFFLMSQHKAPHRHWEPGPDHLTLYDDVEIPVPATLFDDYKGRVSVAKLQTMTIAKHMNDKDLKFRSPDNLTPEQLARWNIAYGPKNEAMRKANLQGQERVRWNYQRYIKDYLRCIASLDDNIGRLLKYLDESGLADSTVVVYSSDQGFYLGDHGWFDKRWMYEESLTMPLIVRWPGTVKPGSRDTHLVQNLDFAQTFLDICGVVIPSDMQGRSLVPLLTNEAPSDWRESIYYHYYEFPGWHDVRRHYGVRTARYKLIHYYDIDEWELFDLQNDPDELRSVYEDPAHARVIKELEAELARLRKHYQVDRFQEPPAPPDPKKVELELVLRWDFAETDGERVQDASGRGHTGVMKNARSVKGRLGQAVAFDGNGSVHTQGSPASLDPTYRPLTVGAWCKPTGGNGVIVSHGSRLFGYSLHFREGYPQFTLHAGQNRFHVRAEQACTLSRWIHLAATVDADARITLWVNGEPVAQLEEGFHVNDRPTDAFSIGADVGQSAGDYDGPLRFRGLIEDVRVYWGVLDRTSLKKWASRD
jgi:arylsulfatase A-like enzyme